jgi:hypothetical protein
MLALFGERFKKDIVQTMLDGESQKQNNAKHGSNLRAVDGVRTKLASPCEFIPRSISIARNQRSEVRNRGSEKEKEDWKEEVTT